MTTDTNNTNTGVRRKKRKPPRKRAVTQQQVIDQLQRYRRLLKRWEDQTDELAARLSKARRRRKVMADKVEYYTQRLRDILPEHDLRLLRAITLEE